MLQISCHIPQMLLASLSHSLFFSFWTLSRLSVPLTFGSGLLQNTYPCSPVSSLPCDLVPSLRCVLLKFASVYQLYERSSFVEHTARFYERSREFLGAAPFSSRLFSSWRGRPGIRNHPLTNTTNLKNVTLNLAFQIYIFWVLGYIRYAVLATLSSAPSRPCMPLLTQLGVHTWPKTSEFMGWPFNKSEHLLNSDMHGWISLTRQSKLYRGRTQPHGSHRWEGELIVEGSSLSRGDGWVARGGSPPERDGDSVYFILDGFPVSALVSMRPNVSIFQLGLCIPE